MDEIHQSIKIIQRCKIYQTDKISNLLGQVQAQMNANPASADLVLYGIALGIEKVSDSRIYEQRNDDRLNELSEKIQKIENREVLEEGEFFPPGDPDTPEEYQALNIEFKHRIDEIKAGIMREFGEDELAVLFMNNGKEFLRHYYNGWQVLEKDNPKVLKEIDEQEKHDLS